MPTANATTWVPMIGGDVVPGYWRVSAKTEQSAQLMIEERMQRRAFFSLCREWRSGGKRVREVVDDTISA